MILGGAGAWIVSKFAPKLGLVDLPNERSSHVIPTPKGGGIGILTAFVLAALFLEIPLAFWLSATFLALFSFLGDKFKISPKFRLLVQFIGAIGLISSVPFSNFFPDLHPLLFVLCLLPLSVFIVGTANFYNFMDGINGIAGITGVIGFGLLAFYAHLLEPGSSFIVLAICMSLSCLGFLPFNIPKAKVFMGDVGSILLGFVFAGMVIWFSRSLLDFICLAAFLLPFYADELTTMVVRLKDRENLVRPHRRHLYQLLANERGVLQWKISAGYGLFQLIVGMSILILKPFGDITVLSLIAVYFGGFIVVSVSVRRKVKYLTQRRKGAKT
ncbi:glycosyltransferase family 4 protein [Thermodesulfovibrionales bacterium]|nr:glycosyltransferase family 4 protein [Thermodesulfovibrionales bacterium]